MVYGICFHLRFTDNNSTSTSTFIKLKQLVTLYSLAKNSLAVDQNGAPFYDVIVNMGLIQLPGIEDYWKTTWTAHIPFFQGLSQ